MFLNDTVNIIFFHIFFHQGRILNVDLIAGYPIELSYWSYITNFKFIPQDFRLNNQQVIIVFPLFQNFHLSSSFFFPFLIWLRPTAQHSILGMTLFILLLFLTLMKILLNVLSSNTKFASDFYQIFFIQLRLSLLLLSSEHYE